MISNSGDTVKLTAEPIAAGQQFILHDITRRCNCTALNTNNIARSME